MIDRETLVAPLLLNYDDNPQEGVDVFRRAIEAGVSNHPDVLMVFGLHLLAANNVIEAEAMLRKVIAMAPKHFLALYNLGFLMFRQKRMQEAIPVFRQVLELEPTHVDAMLMLANALKRQMQRGEALQLITHAQQLEPHNYLLPAFELFEMVYDLDCTDADIFAKTQRVMELRCGSSQIKTALPFRRGNDSKPLCVGFVSGDFKMHPVGHFLHGWLPYVDRSCLTLHAFSMQEVDDMVSQQLRPQFATWHSIARTSDEGVQALAAELSIDVLIDLSGHTDINRLPLFARRAAPVQISYLGWFATTGVVNMDYFLTDRITSPASSQAHHSEQFLYLPDTRLCMSVPSVAPEVKPLPALQNKYVTFGSFQALDKITDQTLNLWRQILVQTPLSRMVICCIQFAQVEIRDLLRERLLALGLPNERIELLPPVTYDAYFHFYQWIDVMLDTIPFPGGTTTAEALWMGVPTLTLVGNTLISRQGASLMSTAGLVNWVTHSENEYAAKAVYWTEHLEELAVLRESLRERMRTSPLFDAPRFAKAFTEAIESAYNARLLLQPLRDI